MQFPVFGKSTTLPSKLGDAGMDEPSSNLPTNCVMNTHRQSATRDLSEFSSRTKLTLGLETSIKCKPSRNPS